MGTKSTGIIGRINDFGQLTIHKKLRRELKINDRNGDVLLVLAITGKDIPDDVAEPVRMTAEILSAMLS